MRVRMNFYNCIDNKMHMDIISTLNIQKLLSESEYRIPIYQRNYAWSIPEVTQLIQDIADYAKEKLAK